jgi:hypothetical protein
MLVVAAGFSGCVADVESVDGTDEDVANEQSELRRRPAFCGGIAGIACPRRGQLCVDDPCDDCDPAQGGADCGGICVNPRRAPACEGIAGLACPRRLTCVDDPRDECIPGQGADCGGLCVNPRCPRVRSEDDRE